MKTLKGVLALIICGMVALWGFNSAIAYDASDRVTVAQNDLGDALMASYYETNDGYQTVVQVINTDINTAIVAKVVFRSPVLSEEALDFMLYLTPGDMWEGVVSQQNGNAMMYSTDDSCLANPGVWASENNPFSQTFFSDKLGTDTNTFGHIDVYGCVAFDITGSTPLPKNDLYNAYHFSTYTTRFSPAAPLDVPNALAGKVALLQDGNRSELNMTALENWEQAYGVISSGYHYLSIGVENGWEITDVNTIAEIEAAIAKDVWALPFDLEEASDTLMVATLPTKWNTGTKFPALTEHHVYTEFPTLVKGVIYQVRDMEENMYSISSVVSGGTASAESLPYEVNINLVTETLSSAINAGYTKGWINVDMPGDSGVSAISQDLGALYYGGAPVLTSYITYYNDGSVTWNPAYAPQATVTYAGVSVRQ